VETAEFADPVPVADDELALFTAEFEILGLTADAGHGVDMVFGAKGGEAFDLGSGVDERFVTDVNFVFDDRKRADRDSGAEVCPRMNYR
jgi:hypothetical protein